MKRILVPTFGLVGLPFMFWLGYREGISSLGDSDQIHEHLDTLFKKHDNTFRNKAVLPPIRRITYPHMTILYSTTLRLPLAVHETIDASSLQQEPYKMVPEGEDIKYNLILEEHKSNIAQQSLEKFAPKLSKAHMASPVNHFASDSHLKATVQKISDIVEDIWETFEVYQRNLTNRCKNVEIISGPIFSHAETKGSGEFDIYQTSYQVQRKYGSAIPQKLYKIIRCNKQEGSYVSAFVVGNQEPKNNNVQLSSFEVPIKQLETKTGLTFGVSGKSLTEFDAAVLGKSKSEFDRQWVEPLLHRSETFKDLQLTYPKLSAHSLQESDSVISTIERLGKARLREVQADTKLDDYSRIPQYLQIRSDIKEDYRLKGLINQLKLAESTALKSCSDKERLKLLKSQVNKYVEILPDLVDTMTKIDDKLVEKIKNQQP